MPESWSRDRSRAVSGSGSGVTDASRPLRLDARRIEARKRIRRPSKGTSYPRGSALDQDGLAAGEVTGLDSVDGAGTTVGDVLLDDELHAPTNSAAATINMARTALMTGSPRAWGFDSA